MGKFANRIQQVLVGADGVANGDFVWPIGNKVTGVRVECLADAVVNVWVGWNSDAQRKDVIIPGQAKNYGIEGGYLDGNKLSINFDPDGGVGLKAALLTIWTELDQEIC